MRILVTGGDGQLGRELARQAGSGHEIETRNRSECDVADQAAVARIIEEVRPDALINCAAWTRVDAAESDPDSAYRVNALGPRVLAGACAARDVMLTHISTDYVFGQRAAAPIDEWHPPKPASVYGASKLAGEREVRSLCSRHQVVRTSWLYGQDGPNFVLTMLRVAAEGRPLRVVSDQLGTPTWTGHLAPALLRLVQLGLPGTYHLTSSGQTSWHGFAEAIFAGSGQPVAVAPITTPEYPTPAARPAYSVLDNRAWRLLGEAPLPDWRDGLTAYLGELRGRQLPGP